MTTNRLLCWFSCGATSAVAIKLALKKYSHLPALIAYCDTGSEHPDNLRFIKDCERWYGQEIHILKSSKYQDIWDVFLKTRYLVGPRGARCTSELKKMVRHKVENPIDDLQVFGFDSSEVARANRFRENNPEVNLCVPLIDENISKLDCLLTLEAEGIDIPLMYRLGFRNNNCIGCVKGGIGYWNKIRRVFPEVYERN
jgi:3'-phosphoadenosine 5'-phosphosulfate sulfotransferase (PAPS reductase)/FAD synthetase